MDKCCHVLQFHQPNASTAASKRSDNFWLQKLLGSLPKYYQVGLILLNKIIFSLHFIFPLQFPVENVNIEKRLQSKNFVF